MKVVSVDGEVFQVPPGAKVFDSQGREIPDPTPVEIPADCEQPETLESMMMRMINVASRRASQDGMESIDEANDFDVEDEENFEDLLTGAELDAISTARELREEIPKERDYGRSDSDSGDSGGEGEDGSADSGVDSGVDDTGESAGEGDGESAEQPDREVAGGVQNRSVRAKAPAKGAGKGKSGKNARR